jgi:hypothetical protein
MTRDLRLKIGGEPDAPRGPVSSRIWWRWLTDALGSPATGDSDWTSGGADAAPPRFPPVVAMALAFTFVVVIVEPALAAEWGQIRAGTTQQTTVRARYGAPTRETSQKIEGYDAVQWVYEGARAPSGMLRMTVDFGLLTPNGYQKDVVRTFKLEPKPEIFNKRLIIDGWGTPTRAGREGELEFFLYQDGLLVYFEKEGERAISLIFTPPQPPLPAAPPAQPSPARPAPSAPPPRP